MPLAARWSPKWRVMPLRHIVFWCVHFRFYWFCRCDNQRWGMMAARCIICDMTTVWSQTPIIHTSIKSACSLFSRSLYQYLPRIVVTAVRANGRQYIVMSVRTLRGWRMEGKNGISAIVVIIRHRYSNISSYSFSLDRMPASTCVNWCNGGARRKM